jgi:hypothetical protein
MASSVTTLAQGDNVGEPTCVVVWDSATQATWLTLRSYMTPNATVPASGVFIDIQCKNDAGEILSPVKINPGFVNAVPGHENSDTDFVMYVDGQIASMSMTGHYAGQPPMFGTWPPELFSLGGPLNKWDALYLKEYPARPGMPAGVKRCVSVNGGYVPIYDT